MRSTSPARTSSYRDQTPPRFFVGLYQYQTVIQDPEFWHALRITIWFTVQAVFITVLAGAGIGPAFFGASSTVSAFFGIFILIPMILPPLVAALIWRYMFYPGGGLVTYYAGGINPRARPGRDSLPVRSGYRLPYAGLRGCVGVDALHVP